MYFHLYIGFDGDKNLHLAHRFPVSTPEHCRKILYWKSKAFNRFKLATSCYALPSLLTEAPQLRPYRDISEHIVAYTALRIQGEWREIPVEPSFEGLNNG